MKKLALIVMTIFLFTSCNQNFDLNKLTKNSFFLEAWNGCTYNYQTAPTLIFTKDNKFSGKSFCNSYGGELVINNSNIKFGNVFSTKMFCADQSTLEDKFLKDLDGVNSARITKGRLMLYKDMQLIMTFASPL